MRLTLCDRLGEVYVYLTCFNNINLCFPEEGFQVFFFFLPTGRCPWVLWKHLLYSIQTVPSGNEWKSVECSRARPGICLHANFTPRDRICQFLMMTKLNQQELVMAYNKNCHSELFLNFRSSKWQPPGGSGNLYVNVINRWSICIRLG